MQQSIDLVLRQRHRLVGSAHEPRHARRSFDKRPRVLADDVHRRGGVDLDEDAVDTERDLTEPEPSASVSAPVPAAESGVAAPRTWLGARLIAFLEGSWRELQRVQWPDRRQVMQATGVVIGFVIVASIFLGVADLVANKVVSFILKGHF